MNRDAQYLFNKTFFLLLIGHGEMTTGTVSLEQPGLKKKMAEGYIVTVVSNF